MYIVINSAVDPKCNPNPEDYPKYMYVDYIRVYKFEEDMNL